MIRAFCLAWLGHRPPVGWSLVLLWLRSWHGHVRGAVYTEGWHRRVVRKGEATKKTKQMINCNRIYPPLTRDRAAILAAAEPRVQEPPETKSLS
jgi:NADH:ubiquinone reductase (H+-translocating)